MKDLDTQAGPIAGLVYCAREKAVLVACQARMRAFSSGYRPDFSIGHNRRFPNFDRATSLISTSAMGRCGAFQYVSTEHYHQNVSLSFSVHGLVSILLLGGSLVLYT